MNMFLKNTNKKESHVFWKIMNSVNIVVNPTIESLVIYSNSGRAKDETLSLRHLRRDGGVTQKITVSAPKFNVKLEVDWAKVVGGKILTTSDSERLADGIKVFVKGTDLPYPDKWYALDNFDYSRLYLLLTETTMNSGVISEPVIPVVFIQTDGLMSFTSESFKEYELMERDSKIQLILPITKKTKKFSPGVEYVNERDIFTYLGEFEDLRGRKIPLTIGNPGNWKTVSEVLINSEIGRISRSSVQSVYGTLASSCKSGSPDLKNDITGGILSILPDIISRVYGQPDLFKRLELGGREFEYIDTLAPASTILTYASLSGKLGPDTLDSTAQDKVKRIISSTMAGIILQKIKPSIEDVENPNLSEVVGITADTLENLGHLSLRTIAFEPVTPYSDSVQYIIEVISLLIGGQEPEDLGTDLTEHLRSMISTLESRKRNFLEVYDIGAGKYLYSDSLPQTVTIEFEDSGLGEYKLRRTEKDKDVSEDLGDVLSEFAKESDENYGRYASTYSIINFGTLRDPKFVHRYTFSAKDVLGFLEREKNRIPQTESLKDEVINSPTKYYYLTRTIINK